MVQHTNLPGSVRRARPEPITRMNRANIAVRLQAAGRSASICMSSSHRPLTTRSQMGYRRRSPAAGSEPGSRVPPPKPDTPNRPNRVRSGCCALGVLKLRRTDQVDRATSYLGLSFTRGKRSARQHHDRSGISTRESPVACASRAARHRASPACLLAGEAVMNTLLVASQPTTSSTSISRVKANDSASARPKGASGGRVTE